MKTISPLPLLMLLFLVAGAAWGGGSAATAQPAERDDLFGPPLPIDAPPGIYSDRGLVRGARLDPLQSLTVTLRPLVKKYDRLVVRLDPAVVYRMGPVGRVRNIDMGGATLTIEAAGTDADGRARIEVQPDAEGQWSGAFWTHEESVSNLRLRALDISAPGRRAEEMIDAVNHNGSGRLEVLDTRIDGFRNAISCDNKGSGPGVSLLIDNSSLLNSFAPDRDHWKQFGQRKGGPANGVYAEAYADLVLRDSLVHHNGWRASAEDATWGSPYSHGLYLNVGKPGTAIPERTLLEGNLISESGSHGVQLRNGGIVRGSLFFRNPFGLSIVAGEVAGNAIVGNAYCWPRDGIVQPGGFDRWKDRGDRAVQVSHADQYTSPTRVHGPVAIRGNAIADAFAPGDRAPISRDADDASPGTVENAGNVALNWHGWTRNTRLNADAGDHAGGASRRRPRGGRDGGDAGADRGGARPAAGKAAGRSRGGCRAT